MMKFVCGLLIGAFLLISCGASRFIEAVEIYYDNQSSTLATENVQGALDELSLGVKKLKRRIRVLERESDNNYSPYWDY